MLYTAINIALVVALIFTCGFSFAMLREFRRFKAHAGEYGLALQEASRAMEAVDEALGRTHDEGAQTVISLGERLEAAERMLGKLKTAEAAATAQLMRLRDRIDEARDVIDETHSANTGYAAGLSPHAPARKAPASTMSAKKPSAKKASGGKPASGRSSDEQAMASSSGMQSSGISGAVAGSGALALAPASATEPQAPRTRKILSWPVIRSTGIAAGSS
jgi:hypothetical protein